MFDTPMELLEKIRLGEDTSLELKSVRFRGEKVEGPKRGDLANEIAAMANSRDGVLVLGIDDKTRDIEGFSLEQLDVVEQYIFEICNESINPPVQFSSFRMNLPDEAGVSRAVLKVDIPRSLFVHRGPDGYFYRQGSSKREMSHEHLYRLMQQRNEVGLIRYEERPVPKSSLSDLVPSLWGRYVTRSDEPDETVLLKRSILFREENETIRASVAGILFCCDHPEHFLPSAYIEAVRYRGTKQDSNYQMDAQKIYGPLDRQIDQAMTFLRRNQTVMAVKKPHRIEKTQFDERAVFEAIVNAVAHRDYSNSGSKIRFFILDDRMEIYSPGSLANTVSVDNIAHRQFTRNELVTSLLSETPVAKASGDVGRSFYMEKRGEGVRIIMDQSMAHSGKKPVYRLLDDSELLLTIFSAPMKPSDDD